MIVNMCLGEGTFGKPYRPKCWKSVEDGMLYVDVGAYRGNTTKATLKTYPTLNAVAIEPVLENFRHLQDNLKNHPQVQTIRRGCWDSQRRGVIFVNPSHASGSTFIGKNRTSKHTVKEAVKLDTLDNILQKLQLGTPHLVKIDTEGAEHLVLKGFHDHNDRTQFHIEYHMNLSQVLTELFKHGVSEVEITLGNRGGSIYGRFK